MSGDIELAAANADLSPGQARFYHACRPALVAGDYRLQARQSVDKLTGEAPGFEVDTPFTIAGPRFKIDAGEVQMVYPPANNVGHYDEDLPHVVLRRKSIPWERSLDDSSVGDDGPPWLALLTLYPGEMQGVEPTRMSVAELLSPPTGILPPAIDKGQLSDAELKQSLLAFDLDLASFQAIAPSLDDLPYLAHVREVDTADKEPLGMDEDGWFSVVVGNRLARAGAENQVFLVSLEGHREHLPGNTVSGYTSIRLVCLVRWSFTAAPARGDFLCLVRALEQRGGVDLLQLPHTPYGKQPQAAEEAADADADAEEGAGKPAGQVAGEALDIGYVPLLNNTRSGETTTSWYRGPFTPVPTKADGNGPYYYSDHAIRYDPETGLFNLAFAGAWQIGRLLALSDAPFARALFDWRRRWYRKRRQIGAAERHLARLPAGAATHTLTLELAAHPGPESAQDPADTLHQALLGCARQSLGAAVEAAPKLIAHEARDQMAAPASGADAARYRERLAAGEDPLYALMDTYFGAADSD